VEAFLSFRLSFSLPGGIPWKPTTGFPFRLQFFLDLAEHCKAAFQGLFAVFQSQVRLQDIHNVRGDRVFPDVMRRVLVLCFQDCIQSIIVGPKKFFLKFIVPESLGFSRIPHLS